jgi:NADH:ubiquinone oxidoreductase subunit 3 (subunit A)
VSDPTDYAFFGALLVIGGVLGIAPVVAPLFLAPRSTGAKTHETYECGVDTEGGAWMRFDISYYLFALIFVVFEVDVLYILPVALVFDSGQYAWRDLIELSLFIGILFLAIIYAWRKGVLHWRSA